MKDSTIAGQKRCCDPAPEGLLEVRLTHADFERLDQEPDFDGGYPAEAVRGFRKVMGAIRAAADERDLYALPSLHFEKRKGDRKHQRSLRRNLPGRLIVEIIPATPKNIGAVVGIEDYHSI